MDPIIAPPPIAVVWLSRADNRYTVLASAVDDNCRVEESPNWRALSYDSEYQNRDWSTPEEAWDAAQKMMRRLLAWGWELRNSDNKPIDTYGNLL